MKRKSLGILLLVIGIGLGLTTVSMALNSPKEDIGELAPASLSKPEVQEENSLPVRIIIPKLDIDTDVQHVGLTTKGNMGVPTNFTDAGWYKYGTVPGNQGSAVIAGHQTNALSLPAVFMPLPKLESGDDLYIVDEEGKKLRFRVIKKEIVPYNLQGQKLEEIFNSKNGRYLNLITCDGEWLPEAKTNDKRLVVYAELVS